MGIKEAKHFIDGASKSTSLKDIRQTHDGVKPVAGIDVAIPMNMGFANNKAIDQAMAIPPMPAQHTADYVLDYVSQFTAAGFTPVAVFDGRRYSPKLATADTRYGNKEKEMEELLAMYADESMDHSIDKIRRKQKLAAQITQDVFYEVMERLKQEGVRIICAPFEADSQLVALSRQGIIDYAVTNDSDIPFQGANKTIRKVTKKGKCQLVVFDNFQKHLAKMFETTKSFGHFALLATMLGNDYVNNLQNFGYKKTIPFMKKYCKANQSDQVAMLRAHVKSFGDSQQMKAFWISLESWEHAPVFIVSSTVANKQAREAFFSSEEAENPVFQISLGPMSHCDPSGSIQVSREFWRYNDLDQDKVGRDAIWKLGFDPMENFRNDPSKLMEYFKLEVWCRTDQALFGLPIQKNTEDQETWSGSILDFTKRPIRTYPDWILINWLTSRDISCEDMDRTTIINTVAKAYDRTPPLFIIPKFLLRGAGGYAVYECIKPSSEDITVHWSTCDGALYELQEEIPKINEDYFTEIFGVRNGSRRRAFLHLTGGSFDIKLQSSKQQ